MNGNMIGGIRSVSVERGHDPRDFSMVAGGGATSAHAGRLAGELGIREVIIPRVASGLCAFGEAVADVKHTYPASYTVRLPELDPRRLDGVFLELERQGREDLHAEGFADTDIVVERSVEMKYVDQVHECRVEIPRFEIDGAASVAEIEDAFHRRHEALYTYCEPDNVAELINVEVSVFGRSPWVDPQVEPTAVTRRPAPQGQRDCLFAEYERAIARRLSSPRLPPRRRRARRTGDRRGGVDHDRRLPGIDARAARPDVYVMTVS